MIYQIAKSNPMIQITQIENFIIKILSTPFRKYNLQPQILPFPPLLPPSRMLKMFGEYLFGQIGGRGIENVGIDGLYRARIFLNCVLTTDARNF